MIIPGVQPSLLMIEDNDEDYEAARRALNRLGVSATIVRCADGDQALDYLHRRGEYSDDAEARLPDLILLDLNLPNTDGREVLSEIKASTELKAIPVVILTTSANPKDIEVCYQQGANSYLLKPVNIALFTSMLKLVCDYWFGTVVLPDSKV